MKINRTGKEFLTAMNTFAKSKAAEVSSMALLNNAEAYSLGLKMSVKMKHLFPSFCEDHFTIDRTTHACYFFYFNSMFERYIFKLCTNVSRLGACVWSFALRCLTLKAPITIIVVCFVFCRLLLKSLLQTVWTQIRLLL